jgi:hypothetical protein
MNLLIVYYIECRLREIYFKTEISAELDAILAAMALEVEPTPVRKQLKDLKHQGHKLVFRTRPRYRLLIA